MAFALEYRSEPKTVVLKHLSQNPSHEWDDFRRYCRGSRHVQRHVFKEVKADMQLKGLIPMIPGDKAYNIVRREVEQELKQKQEEAAKAAAPVTPPNPEPAPEPQAPAQDLAKDDGDVDWESIPDEPEEAAGPLKSAVTGAFLRNSNSLTAKIRYDIEVMIKEMPDLSVKEILQAFNLPEDRSQVVRLIRDRIRKFIDYIPTPGASSMPVTAKENAANYAKCLADLSTLSKADVKTLTCASYRERFKRPAMPNGVFNNTKIKMIRTWESGQGPAANRPAAATESGSFGNGLLAPRPPATRRSREVVPEGPVLAPGVVICRVDDAKYAETERRTLRNILPDAIRESLRLFGITCPPLTSALVELEDETKVLELRVK
jgi:hypothetical protein